MTIPTRPLSGRVAGALATTLLCAGFLLSTGCSKSPAQIEKKDYGLGQHYLAEGKLNEAVIEFQNVLKVNPKSVKGRLGLADAYMKKGWTTQAVLEYREVAKEDPLSLPAHLAMARYGVNSGQWTAVEPEIAAILKIDPNNLEGLTFEGERQLALGHQKKAEEFLNKALALSPGSVPVLVGMGDLDRSENLSDKAASFYQQALAKDPNNGRALTGLGYLAQSQGKTDEAKEDFQKAMEADKGDLRSRIIYTNFLAGQGKVQEAIDLLKAVPKKAADLRIPVKIAEYEILLGQNSKALALMRPLELEKIDFPDIYLILAKAYQGLGNTTEALNEATKLSTMKGVPPMMMVAAAQVELAGRHPGKARDMLEPLRTSPGLSPLYWQILGETYMARRDSARAEALYREGLAKYPDNAGLLMSLSDAEFVRHHDGRARKILEGLLAENPQNPNLVGKIAVIIGRSGGVPKELAYLRTMAHTYPSNEALNALYLVTLATNKKLPQAISEGEGILAAHPAMQNVRALVASFDLSSGHRKKGASLYRQILAADPNNLQALSSLANLEYVDQHYPESESLYRRVLRALPDNPNYETSLGEVLLAEKQQSAALSYFRKALATDPKQYIAALELGRAEVLGGDPREALNHLSPLVSLNFSQTRKAEVQWLWGLANDIAGNQTVAADALGKAVRLDPKNPAYLESLGEFWMNRSQWDRALPLLKRGYALDRKNALLGLQIDWGTLLSSRGAPDPARLERIRQEAASYGKAHPGNLTAGLIEASADQALKKNDRALAVYDRLLAAHPGDRLSLLGKAKILLAQGQGAPVKKIARQLLAQNPQDIEANLLLATLAAQAKDNKGVAEYLGRVHKSAPKAVGPAMGLASADLSLGRFEEAKAVSFALYEAHSGFYQALSLKVSAEMGLKEYPEALRDLKVLAAHAKKPAPFYNLASVAAGKMGDAAAAQKYLDKAFRADPGNPSVLNNMAFSLAERDTDLSRALDYARKALAKADTPDVQDTLGYVLYRMRRFDQAQPHFESAYKANFRDPEFLFHMGLNESKLGQKDRARELLEKALTSGDLSPEERSEAHKVLG